MFGALSSWILKAAGWTIEGRFPDAVKKYIIIVMPHTSGWDFVLGALIRSALGFRSDFVAKHTLFRPPFGGFFRWMGGHPIDRSRRGGYVDSVVELFESREKFVLAIAPEGTRRKVDKLKTGFYFIARRAGVPIVMGKFDYSRKKVTISEPFWPTGDKEADFQQILAFFRDARGRHPELGIDEEVKF